MTYNKNIFRLLIGVIILFGIATAIRFTDLPTCSEISQWIEGWGALAPFAFIAAYVVATVLFVPGTVLTMLSGLAFGPWLGTAYVSAGSMLGAMAAFLISRYFARESLEQMLSRQAWFQKFRASLDQNGFNFVLFVRLVPLFPFNGLNYACGLVPLKFKDFALGSFIGMLPGTFAYVYAGNAVGCAVIDGRAGLPGELKLKLLIAVSLLAGLSLLPMLLKKYRV